MPSKEDEASAYFQGFNRKIQSSNTPPVGARSRSGSGGQQDSHAQQGGTTLLTQASQSANARGQSPAVARARSQTQNSSQKLQAVRSKPKNLSPVDPSRHPSLLPKQLPAVAGKMCLVLDVDETLVHSSYQPVHRYDLHLPLRVNGSICNVYVAYRPGLKEFLAAVSPLFEIVIFTASVSIYCDPLMDELDPTGRLGSARLFREHCSVVNGNYVKDLSLLGRPLDRITIIDNSPVAYLFQPRNAIPILSWFDDPSDTEFSKLMPLLEQLARADSVYDLLDQYNSQQMTSPASPSLDPPRR